MEELIAQLEPLGALPPTSPSVYELRAAAALSQAISLKRIADALDRQRPDPEGFAQIVAQAVDQVLRRSGR